MGALTDHQRRMCGDKVRHLTGRGARKLARQMRRRGDVQMGAYRCEYCGFWHIGHQS